MARDLPWWTPDVPLETVVGCCAPDEAEPKVAAWLQAHGVDVPLIGLSEALSSAEWIDPTLAPWAAGFHAWLACLRSPPWTDGAIERLHATAVTRWDQPAEAERRRRWIAELEGGLARSDGAGGWALWIPCAEGFWVVYDGQTPARKRTRP